MGSKHSVLGRDIVASTSRSADRQSGDPPTPRCTESSPRTGSAATVFGTSSATSPTSSSASSSSSPAALHASFGLPPFTGVESVDAREVMSQSWYEDAVYHILLPENFTELDRLARKTHRLRMDAKSILKKAAEDYFDETVDPKDPDRIYNVTQAERAMKIIERSLTPVAGGRQPRRRARGIEQVLSTVNEA
ncbi:hypothetical protein BCR35DRAFT_309708 [Leucosporidium creatinivorum]|uniref:Uncharacterized protein n=1 Tax=Leucosporidium creatinivorum TaxID=106004 RepID=A0A1Y2DCY5_9BASI|nr:hypothetical protein BCR35DRAFT_309708 [Leucosporidium creatinivorum]